MNSKADSDPKHLRNERIKWAKAAYTTHRANFEAVEMLLDNGIKPNVGDLVLARVQEIGSIRKSLRPGSV